MRRKPLREPPRGGGKVNNNQVKKRNQNLHILLSQYCDSQSLNRKNKNIAVHICIPLTPARTDFDPVSTELGPTIQNRNDSKNDLKIENIIDRKGSKTNRSEKTINSPKSRRSSRSRKNVENKTENIKEKQSSFFSIIEGDVDDKLQAVLTGSQSGILLQNANDEKCKEQFISEIIDIVLYCISASF